MSIFSMFGRTGKFREVVSIPPPRVSRVRRLGGYDDRTVDVVRLAELETRCQATLDRWYSERTVEQRERLQDIRDAMRVELIGTIMSHRLPPRFVTRYPRDWWESLKERFAPSWFLDRHPVVWTEINVEMMMLFPEIRDPKFKGNLPVGEIHETETDNYRW